jgi:ureidoglycolate lyase
MLGMACEWQGLPSQACKAILCWRYSMARTIEIPLLPLEERGFAPFGQIIGDGVSPPVYEGDGLRSWRLDFDVAGRTELMVIRYDHRPLTFSKLERHLDVTQSFIALGGAASVMVVAPPTGTDEVPRPDDIRAFHIPGEVGIMLWRGIWHALTRFPLDPGGASFAFLTDADTQRELERQNATGEPPTRTQVVDYGQQDGLQFEIIM